MTDIKTIAEGRGLNEFSKGIAAKGTKDNRPELKSARRI